jgi:hypothetical protein
MTESLNIPNDLLAQLLDAKTTNDVSAILGRLPVVDPEAYSWEYKGASGDWREGHLHWIPVGRDRGNGGRIKLAGQPTSPIAERLINGMEALIELERLRELAADPFAPMPATPREAALRYFGLPRLDSIPRIADGAKRKLLEEAIERVRGRLAIRLARAGTNGSMQFSVTVEDQGVGQTPTRLHDTLLSLGQTDKADKPYLIGVFGQGGSSTYAASEVSFVVSRRATTTGGDRRIGWSIVRQVFPKHRRDPYFAYLAATPDGQVPSFSRVVADAAGFTQGTRFTHIKYDFGGAGQAVVRLLYQALNHVLFNPILPYNLFTLDKARPELMQGTAQRLARKVLRSDRQSALDKSFERQPVGPTE